MNPEAKTAPKPRKLTLETLKALVHYDPATGIFTPLKSKSGRRNGKFGSVGPQGYVQICINYEYFSGHRLAWFYVTGKWPARLIDHRDGNPSNNAFANLREANATQNGANKKRRRDSKAPYKGICWSKAHNHWQANIRIDGRLRHLGSFPTPELARDAYQAAAREYFGEFARFA